MISVTVLNTDFVLEKVDYRQHWETIRPLLADMAVDWIPEDAFMLLVNKQASLFMDVTTGAFAIVQVFKNEQQENYLFIFAFWTPATVDAEEYWPAMQQLAKNIEASYVEMQSSRKGFYKKLAWEFKHAVFQRRV